MLNDYDVYITNVQLGWGTPVPWYYEYFQTAERANCKPWELIDEWTPREFWHEATKVVVLAESDHAEHVKQQGANDSSGSTAPKGPLGKVRDRLRR